MVVAYSRLLRDQLSDALHGPANLAIVDHPVQRLRQAQNNEITTPVLDIVDRLHGELTRSRPASEIGEGTSFPSWRRRAPSDATPPV